MKQNRLGYGVFATGVLLAAGTAQAELSATVTATSDYDFRGITQSAQDPALQLSIDWAHENGIYAGLWGSNVDFDGGEGTDFESESDVEVNLFLGYGGAITDELAYDIGAVYYLYLPDDDDIDYYELYAGLSQGIFSGMVWYAPDYVNSGDSAWYLEGNAEVPLPWWELGLNLHLGYSTGDAWDEDNGVDSYFDYSVGIGRSFGNFDFEVKWVDGSDLSELEDTPRNASSSESRVIFTVATTFPWGGE